MNIKNNFFEKLFTQIDLYNVIILHGTAKAQCIALTNGATLYIT